MARSERTTTGRKLCAAPASATAHAEGATKVSRATDGYPTVADAPASDTSGVLPIAPLPNGPRAFSSAHLPLPLPPGHRFPAQKYTLLAQRLREVGWQMSGAPAAPQEDLERVHTAAYLGALSTLSLSAKDERRLGLPQSKALLERERHTVGGTLAALYDACARGYGVNLGGGTHHAFAGRGAGFCVFNDLAVAAYHALEHGLAARVLVVDLDVHQGDGTAHLCAFDPHVFTYSVHGAHNYPFHKERSSCDVPLEDGVTDEAYLERLGATLPPALAHFRPELALYVGGTDVLAGDRFGRAALSLAGTEARDRFVYDLLRAAGVPVVYTMGGGYHKDIGVTVEAHVRGVEALKEVYAGYGAETV